MDRDNQGTKKTAGISEEGYKPILLDKLLGILKPSGGVFYRRDQVRGVFCRWDNFAAADATCSIVDQYWLHSNDVPAYMSGICFLADRSRPVDTLCSATGVGKKRLCYCVPTVAPMASSTGAPTATPTAAPTTTPTAAPTATPTAAPTASPTAAPFSTPRVINLHSRAPQPREKCFIVQVPRVFHFRPCS